MKKLRINPGKYRKLRPAELEKRGFSPKSENYIGPRGKIVSKRVYQQSQLFKREGFFVTLEKRSANILSGVWERAKRLLNAALGRTEQAKREKAERLQPREKPSPFFTPKKQRPSPGPYGYVSKGGYSSSSLWRFAYDANGKIVRVAVSKAVATNFRHASNTGRSYTFKGEDGLTYYLPAPGAKLEKLLDYAERVTGNRDPVDDRFYKEAAFWAA